MMLSAIYLQPHTGKQNDMTGAFALRDEIIAKGETQSAIFMKLFEKLAENWKKDIKMENESSRPGNVSLLRLFYQLALR